MKQLKRKQLKSKSAVRKRGPAVLRLKSERVQSARFPGQRRGRGGGPLVGRLLGLARRTVRRVNRGQKNRVPFH